MKKKSKNLTVGEVVPQFLEELDGLNSFSDFRQKQSLCKTWIVPHLGNIKLTELSDGDVQKMLNSACKLGRTRKTIKNIKGTLSLFLKYCRRYKLTTYRFDDVEIPHSAKSKGKTILSPSDVKKLFETELTLYKDKVTADPYIHYYRLMVLTGLRPSEMLGLRKMDIDLDSQKILIKQAINIFGEVTEGKNSNALRAVPLCETAVEEIKIQMKIAKGDYLFTDTNEPLIRDFWQRYCNFNGLTKTTLYELRHTFVSIAKCLPEGEIKSLVGHSKNMDTYGVYSHALDGDNLKVANDIQSCFDNLVVK